MIAARPLAVISLVLMVSAIGLAWAFEIIGDYIPCPLCLQQRWPYYVAIPLAVLGLLLFARAPLSRTLIIGAGVAMAIGAALGVYHAGAEWAWWEGPNTCGSGSIDAGVTSAANLLSAIQETEFVSCTDVQGRFLGLSFAGWNAAAAAAASLTAFASVAMPRRSE